MQLPVQLGFGTLRAEVIPQVLRVPLRPSVDLRVALFSGRYQNPLESLYKLENLVASDHCLPMVQRVSVIFRSFRTLWECRSVVTSYDSVSAEGMNLSQHDTVF